MPSDEDTPRPCEAFIERLFLLRDGTLSEQHRNQVLSHLASCTHCKAAYEKLQSMEGAFEAMLAGFDETLSDFEQRAERCLRQARDIHAARSAPRRRASPKAFWFALAAVLLLAVVAAFFLIGRFAPDEAVTTEVATDTPALEPDAGPVKKDTQDTDPAYTPPVPEDRPVPEEPPTWEVAMVDAQAGQSRGAKRWQHGDRFFLELNLSTRLHVYVIALDADLIPQFWFPRYLPGAPPGRPQWDFSGHAGSLLEGHCRIPKSEREAFFLAESGGRSEFFLAFASPEELSEGKRLDLLAGLRAVAKQTGTDDLTTTEATERLITYLRSHLDLALHHVLQYRVRK